MRPPLPDASALRRASLAVRDAEEQDTPFLRHLYATTRAEELAGVPWPDAVKSAFLDQQFSLQHRHYLAHHPHADRLVVLRHDRPAGRLYLDRATAIWRILDIAMLPDAQGVGSGTALLRWVLRGARLARVDGVDLHVLHDNQRAAKLYATLGFVPATSSTSFATPSHGRMLWRVPIS